MLGEGEDTVNQPRHQFWLPLARLLLDAGADPNDSQGLYNRMFGASDDHLRLLLAYGLGRGDGGPWYGRFGTALPSPHQMLEDQLLWAAERNLIGRAQLLIDNGADPDGLGFWFTGDEGRTAYQRAVLAGNAELADLLLTAGAAPANLDPVQELVSGCLRLDRSRVDELITTDRTLVQQAIETEPAAVLQAVQLGRAEAVSLLCGLGFDVNVVRRISALHEAASTGDLVMVEHLLTLGADPNLRDREFDATPLGWADHGRHQPVVDRLAPITRPDPS